MAAMAEFCGNKALCFREYNLDQFMLLQDYSGFRNHSQNLHSVAPRKRDSGEEEMKLTG